MAIDFKTLEVGKYAQVTSANTGTLQARKGANGAITLYWRWRHAGKDGRVEIGLYDGLIPPMKASHTNGRYNVLAATLRANELADQHLESLRLGAGGYAAVQLEAQTKRLAEIAQREIDSKNRIEALEQRNAWTLAKLMAMYCEHLNATGKKSTKDVANIFSNHISIPYSAISQKPARELLLDDVVDMMRRLNELKKERTANKLRSYLRAAFSLALRAKTDASVNRLFTRFGITTNPVSATVPNAAANRTDKNPLSIDEMQTYWKILKQIDGAKGAVLRLHLLTGGQRPAQLVRLTRKDISTDSMVLWDGKGKRQAPRRHEIPILPESQKELDYFLSLSATKSTTLNPCLLTTNSGKTGISNTTITTWASEIVGDKISQFSLKRVRSGIETLLSKHRVGVEVRGELQSHGLGGVQKRSYDGHDFLDEKRSALELLLATLEETNAKVVKIGLRRA